VKDEERKPRSRHVARLLFWALLLAFRLHAAPEIDQPAPPLKGTLLSGEPFDLAQMRGKVVLLNFYSSYCKYCAYEIGNLETIYERHRAQGLEVIELAVDELADRDRVRHILSNYGLPGAMVDELRESGFERRYPTPTTFLVDREGVLRDKHWGAKTAPYFREIVLPLLREQSKGPQPAARRDQ
jgi:cytochrome c biogenesis protein CcmG, thiol:disulfide interchange protein DsbE